ncbi:hypothetical protein CR159_15590 [Pollutimonas subterranea]|uniref:Uncharacterized protein n=1 Tax=Pollutimonas subterranea TaxID=2045210 RepID=A0A2N4U1U0_9BURK|nr:hypothetical protein CR159_15590 [Pollutimonas subterranea]
MSMVSCPVAIPICGIHLSAGNGGGSGPQHLLDYLDKLDLKGFVCHRDDGEGVGVTLTDDFAQRYTPQFDTTLLCQQLNLSTTDKPDDLEREIVLALLASPVRFEFPSFEEFASAVNIRRNIVQNARSTALAFDTEHAERPEDYWNYDLSSGFTVKPGKPLIEALQKTTQPERSGKLYSFSCYRATEYVILLSIAQELAECNPAVLAKLQQQWETRAIMSGQFHDVFLYEYGSMAQPLPPCYYIPGDRLWFRNPDEQSSNVEGYEGSWVFYLGDGLFTNFWKRDQPFTLRSKCVELFHWRNATYRNADGKLLVDDDVVDARVAQSMQDPGEVDRIVDLMLRLRDPRDVYRDGGCIDTTRECARRVRPGTGGLAFDR